MRLNRQAQLTDDTFQGGRPKSWSGGLPAEQAIAAVRGDRDKLSLVADSAHEAGEPSRDGYVRHRADAIQYPTD